MLGFGALAETALAEIPLQNAPAPPPAPPIEGGHGAYPEYLRKPVRPIWDRGPAPGATPVARAPDIAPDIAPPPPAPKPSPQVKPDLPLLRPDVFGRDIILPSTPPRVWARSNLVEDADTAPLLPAEPVIPDAHAHLQEADDRTEAHAAVTVEADGNLAEDHDTVLADAKLSTPLRANLTVREDHDQVRSSAATDDDDEAIALLLH